MSVACSWTIRFQNIKKHFLRGRLRADDKYKPLKYLDQPLQYKFPPVMDGTQLRRFQSSWFSKYPWLTDSRSENGGYCAYCLAFASSVRSNRYFGALVQSPTVKFQKPLEALASHEKLEYYKNAYTRIVSFLEFMSGKFQSLVAQVNTSHAVQIGKNREVYGQ